MSWFKLKSNQLLLMAICAIFIAFILRSLHLDGYFWTIWLVGTAFLIISIVYRIFGENGKK